MGVPKRSPDVRVPMNAFSSAAKSLHGRRAPRSAFSGKAVSRRAWPEYILSLKTRRLQRTLQPFAGAETTEAARWEEGYWEIFAGAGPDVPKDEIRDVSIGTLLATMNRSFRC